MIHNAIVLLSGGMDSAVCLARLRQTYSAEQIKALFLDYGQKNIRERQAAKEISCYYGVELWEVDVADAFRFCKNGLIARNNKPIVEQEYCMAAGGMINASRVEVPFRNGIMLSVAIGVAMTVYPEDDVQIVYGACDGEIIQYYDCKPDFVERMNALAQAASFGRITVVAPYIMKSKIETVRDGWAMQVPFHLTWSCYENGSVPCGKCDACYKRQQTLRQSGE